MAAHTKINIFPTGMALGLLLSLSFVVCVIFGLIFPSASMYQVWLPLLPGVAWISWSSVLLGVVETFAYGWYIAIIFVPLYNFFLPRVSS